MEIPSIGEYNTLFYFIDDLQGWATIELKRRGVQGLASGIVVIESLIEFKRESSSLRGKSPTMVLIVTETATRLSVAQANNIRG